MKPPLRLVWCQGGNRRSAALARKFGWHHGFRSDDTNSNDGKVALLDCHWEKPDWPRHLMAAYMTHPRLATVPDTMTLDELDRTVMQAEMIAPLCDHPLIVPKCEGLIERLPRMIGGKQVVLGFSIPTGYGGTPLPFWDFMSWPVHILGGDARKQLDLCNYLPNVISADGNVAWMLARRGIVIKDTGVGGKTIRQLDGQRWPTEDAHLECLRRSFVNLRKFWNRHYRIDWL